MPTLYLSTAFFYFSGVGIVLITVSGIAWRLTANDSPSCRAMLGLGGEVEEDFNNGRFLAPIRPTGPANGQMNNQNSQAAGRAQHPYAGTLSGCSWISIQARLDVWKLIFSHDVFRFSLSTPAALIPGVNARVSSTSPSSGSSRSFSRIGSKLGSRCHCSASLVPVSTKVMPTQLLAFDIRLISFQLFFWQKCNDQCNGAQPSSKLSLSSLGTTSAAPTFTTAPWWPSSSKCQPHPQLQPKH